MLFCLGFEVTNVIRLMTCMAVVSGLYFLLSLNLRCLSCLLLFEEVGLSRLQFGTVRFRLYIIGAVSLK